MELSKLNVLAFIGYKPLKPLMGDVWIERDDIYIFDGKNANILSKAPSNNINIDAPFANPFKIYPSHYPCCGAPVDSYKSKCEYCGVEHRKFHIKINR